MIFVVAAFAVWILYECAGYDRDMKQMDRILGSLGRYDLTDIIVGKEPMVCAHMSYDQAHRILTAATNVDGDGI